MYTIRLDAELSAKIANKINPQEKDCWRNAYNALLELPSGAVYVEGWALDKDNLTFEHGWVENDNRVIDPTLFNKPIRYFSGLRLSANELMEALKQTQFNLPIVWHLYGWGGCEHPGYMAAQSNALKAVDFVHY